MTRRWMAWLLVLAVLFAACGGGGDEASEPAETTAAIAADDDLPETTTTEAAPATTEAQEMEEEAPPVGQGSDYCRRAQEEDTLEPIDIFSGDLETEIQRFLEALDMMVDNAPSEIRDDVELVAGAGRTLAALLEEYDYNLLAIPPEEAEKLESLNSAELEAASRRIAEFCGVDFDETAGDVGSGMGGTGTLPDDFPEALIPPGARDGVENLGPAGFAFLVDASFEDTVAHFEDLLGASSFSGEDGAAIVQGTYEGDQVLATISQETPVVVTVTPLGF